METSPPGAPKRRFAGRRPAPGGRVDGLGALAETLLSAPKVSPAAPAPAAGGTSPPTPGPAPDEAGFPLPP
jgi:hypothetical protein